MNRKYFFREFEPKDQDGVYTLILSILENEFNDIPPENFLVDVRDVENNYTGNGNEFIVCEHEGMVVGTIAVKRDDEETALLRRFFVNPHYRGKEIGKRLIQKIFEVCKESGYKKVLFTGNNKMHKVKSVLSKAGFKEEEDILLKGLEIFKLSYKL
jgi:N-acetylglutamate synthase-like GNAT family acetyltransferase